MRRYKRGVLILLVVVEKISINDDSGEEEGERGVLVVKK